MDAGFLNFHKEEDFSSYFLDSYGDDSEGYESLNGIDNHFEWNWDAEQEINGDVAVLPVSSTTPSEFNLTSSSPPTKDDFHKLMNDWSLINFEIVEPDQFVIPQPQQASAESDDLVAQSENFDITKYIEDDGGAEPKQLKLGGKRIDMAGRRYLVDEENSTMSSSESSSEDDDDDGEKSDRKSSSPLPGNNVVLMKKDPEEDEDVTVDVETVGDQPVLEAGDLNSLLEQFEATENTNFELKLVNNVTDDSLENIKNIKEEPPSLDTIKQEYTIPMQQSPIKTPQKCNSRIKPEPLPSTSPSSSSTSSETNDTYFTTQEKDEKAKSKQILDQLPTELVDRIRQSSKRKPIPVIPPKIPTKRRLLTSSHQQHQQQVQQQSCNHAKIKMQKTIQLDHNYCGTQTPRKDSGFSSCEEDDRIIRQQPTVKNADGKLMVSLLKTNTIKKKLNLEEYKKRIQNRTSSNNTSGYSSPAGDEDENTRRLRHQEMLVKMAEELVTLQQQQQPQPDDSTSNNKTLLEQQQQQQKEQVVVTKPPSNIVRKTLVSIGVNTDESWLNLEPNLHNYSPQSLISSIVERLPKIKPVIAQIEHGEDKTIVYIDKLAPKIEKRNSSTQTIHSSVTTTTATRRRRTSSSSSDVSSVSSDSSRTPSPVRRRHKEQMKEVEERRVIYVGKISDATNREDLRRRFNRFGPITYISVHYRRHADNYAFITYQRKEEAFEALEKGNDDPSLPQYDLSFGGRRLFCQTSYSDLDNVNDDEYWFPHGGIVSPPPPVIMDSFYNRQEAEDSFDVLLRQAQAKLRKRQL